MLEVRELHVRVGRREVLRGVSCRVGPRELVGVVGPPESGKTTLLKAIAGLVPLERGEVWFGGVRVLPAPEAQAQAFRQGLGMSFQNDALFDALSVYENVAFPLRRRGYEEARLTARVRERLEQVGLWEARDKMPAQLSGGMRKRVGIARAAAGELEVGLFDDPTAGLDPMTSAAILDLIIALRRDRPVPTLVVSNDLPSLLPACTRALMLRDGVVVYDGAPERMSTSERAEVAQFVTGADEGPL